jgi:hypothetical protein
VVEEAIDHEEHVAGDSEHLREDISLTQNVAKTAPDAA